MSDVLSVTCCGCNSRMVVLHCPAAEQHEAIENFAAGHRGCGDE